ARSPRSSLFPYTTLFRSWSRMPTAIPATAVVAPTGRTCFVPAASAFTSFVGESEVSRRMYETRIATMIDQKTAVIVEKPATRKRSEEHTSELQSRFDLVC